MHRHELPLTETHGTTENRHENTASGRCPERKTPKIQALYEEFRIEARWNYFPAVRNLSGWNRRKKEGRFQIARLPLFLVSVKLFSDFIRLAFYVGFRRTVSAGNLGRSDAESFVKQDVTFFFVQILSDELRP